MSKEFGIGAIHGINLLCNDFCEYMEECEEDNVGMSYEELADTLQQYAEDFVKAFMKAYKLTEQDLIE